MNDIMVLVLSNLEKVGFGILLFLGAYIANIILGVWKNVKIEGRQFDYNLILRSLIKFVVLGIGIALLSIVISVVPIYITFVGVVVEEETLAVVDNIIIIGMFLTATIRYIKDSIEKLNIVLHNS